MQNSLKVNLLEFSTNTIHNIYFSTLIAKYRILRFLSQTSRINTGTVHLRDTILYRLALFRSSMSDVNNKREYDTHMEC